MEGIAPAAFRQDSLDSSVGDLTDKPAGKFGWVGPVLLLLAGLFLQNAGLYNGTKVYVRWMDELSEAEKLPHHNSTTRDFKLEDPLYELFSGLKMLDVPEVSWGPTLVEVLTSSVSIIWLGWVARDQNLKLWTKVMLSGAVLAALKGFIAWCTILPDSDTWEGCQERLSKDGLAYFREHAGGGPSGGFESVQNFFGVVADISMLSIRSMSLMGRVGRHRVCADTVFSSPTCFCMLLSVSLYDVVRGCTEQLEPVRRATVRSITGLALGLVLLADLALTVLGMRHYTLDVAIALPVTLLVYTNPVISIAANRWVEDWSKARPFTASVQPLLQPFSPGGSRVTETPEQSIMEQDPSTTPLRDLGQATVPPCCLPFCPLGGLYYLRDQPGTPGQRPWTDECKQRHQDKLIEFSRIREDKAERQRKLKEEIDRVHRRARENEAKAAVSHEPRLAEELRLLAAHEEGVVAEANKRLEAERQAAANWESRVTSEMKRFAIGEAEFREFKAQHSNAAKRLQQEAADARSAWMVQERRIQRYKQELETLQDASNGLREYVPAQLECLKPQELDVDEVEQADVVKPSEEDTTEPVKFDFVELQGEDASQLCNADSVQHHEDHVAQQLEEDASEPAEDGAPGPADGVSETLREFASNSQVEGVVEPHNDDEGVVEIRREPTEPDNLTPKESGGREDAF